VRTHLKDPVGAFVAGLFLLSACASLSACNEVAATPPSADATAAFAMRADANMVGATVDVASVDGPPADLASRFRQSFDEAASARRIALAPPAKAHYLVRGYLTASPIEGGAEIDAVWDIFTPNKRRVQRLTDAIAVKGAGEDAWAMVDDAALASIAGKCADDLAAYLSNTPEAAPESSAALSYAQ
jgi:hypothetical protein